MAESEGAAISALVSGDLAPAAGQRSGSECVDAASASVASTHAAATTSAPVREASDVKMPCYTGRTYMQCLQQGNTDGETSRSTDCQAASATDIDPNLGSDQHGNIERPQAYAVAAAERFARRQLSRLRKRDDNKDAAAAATATAIQPTKSGGVGFRQRGSFADHTTCDHSSDVEPSAQAVVYCSGKLNRLCHHTKSGRRAGSGCGTPKDANAGRNAASAERQPRPKKSMKRKAKVKGAAAVQLPIEFKRKLNRMRIENLLHNLSEACKVQLHDPNRCRKCSKRLSEESRERFLQRHKTRLESALVDRRYESHLIRSTPLAAVGAVAGQLPRHGDSPSATWRRLVNKAAKPPE